MRRRIIAALAGFMVALTCGWPARADEVRYPPSGDFQFVVNAAPGWTSSSDDNGLKLSPPEAFGVVLLSVKRDLTFPMRTVPEMAKAMGEAAGIGSFDKQEPVKAAGRDAQAFYGHLTNANGLTLDVKIVFFSLEQTMWATETVMTRQGLQDYEQRSLDQTLSGVSLVKGK